MMSCQKTLVYKSKTGDFCFVSDIFLVEKIKDSSSLYESEITLIREGESVVVYSDFDCEYLKREIDRKS